MDAIRTLLDNFIVQYNIYIVSNQNMYFKTFIIYNFNKVEKLWKVINTSNGCKTSLDVKALILTYLHKCFLQQQN